jgi:hypothetical protein
VVRVGAVLGALVAMMASPSSAAQTAIQNGSFDANLTGWTIQSDPSWSIAWSASGYTAAGGAAKVSWVGPDERRQFVPLAQSGIAVTPGVTYEYAAVAKLHVDPSKTSDGPVIVQALFHGDDPAIPLLGASDEFFGSGWVPLRGYVVAPPGAMTLTVRLAMPGTSGRWPLQTDTQVAMFDDVSVRPLPTSAEFMVGWERYVASSDPNVRYDKGGPTTTIAAGEGAVLVWATASAETITITPDVGTVPRTGSHVVRPTHTTTFTLTATGPFGSITKQVTVNVTP